MNKLIVSMAGGNQTQSLYDSWHLPNRKKNILTISSYFLSVLSLLLIPPYIKFLHLVQSRYLVDFIRQILNFALKLE